MSAEEASPGTDFIRSRVAADVASGRHGGRVATRFPPEPNGWLHIGHAKAIGISFEVAEEFGGRCFLRFDDTNPTTEETEFVDGIQGDIRWLGFDWGDRLGFASDFFGRLYECAVRLVERGSAFVCDLSSDEIRAHNGSLTEPGRNSPYRERSVDESLDLLARMRAGEFEAGARVLRAKIDMASPILPMRDPILYRINRDPHHRTGKEWCIYPMYDFAQALTDAFQGITHSLCSAEFTDHRPLYDWLLEQLEFDPRPQQIEFSRLALSHTVTSKRKLRRLVEEGHVSGWDDPRMPTLAALRRRGVPATAIRRFVREVGMTRRENLIQLARLEAAIRDELNESSPRVMGVLRPLKLVIENHPEGETEEFELPVNPRDEAAGTRRVPFSREVWIERDDFLEDPPAKFFRLAPGREVRLRGAYLVTCTDVVRGPDGEIAELRGRSDPQSRGGSAPDGRKVKGTIHWVSVPHALEAEVRLYDTLFTVESPNDAPSEAGTGDFTELINPDSLVVHQGCRVEPGLAGARPGDRFQFERNGYFCVDPDSREGALVFNRTVTLRDSWKKVKGAGS